MKQHEVGSVVVTSDDDKSLLGIITDRDIALKLTEFKGRLHEILAKEVMSKKLLVLEKNQRLNDAIIAMRKKGVRRAPVIDDKRNLSGIISVDDLLFTIINELCELQHLIKHQMVHFKCCEGSE